MHDQDDLQVFRQWMILRTLGARRHGMSVRELAEERGVDRQTIRRDLKLSQTLGFPPVESRGPRGRAAAASHASKLGELRRLRGSTPTLPRIFSA